MTPLITTEENVNRDLGHSHNDSVDTPAMAQEGVMGDDGLDCDRILCAKNA